MAVDIGPRIGIDGEKEFRQEITNINQQLRTLASEAKEVASAFDDNADSQEALEEKTKVLNKQIDAQKQKVSLMEEGLKKATAQFGEADTRTLKWEQGLREARTSLNKMESDLRKTTGEVDDFNEELGDSKKSLDDFGDGRKKWVSTLTDIKSGFDLAIGAIKGVYGAVKNVIQGFIDLGEETREFRTEVGKLNAAFTTSGKTAEEAWEIYKDFYQILGDKGQATEASQLLANLTSDTREMAKWVDIAAGVYGTFGASLPIEALVESANETARVSKVTGNLADALNWVGIKEDEFNEKLALASTESERNALIMSTLGSAYDEATKSFYSTNEQIVALRDNELEAEKSTSRLGEVADDIVIKFNNDFAPAINNVKEALADMMETTGSEEAQRKFEQSLEDLVTQIEEKLPDYVDSGAKIGKALLQGIISVVPETAQVINENFNPARIMSEELAKREGFAASFASGFLRSSSALVTPALTAAETVGGIVNGINTPKTESTVRVEIPLNINGQQFSRAILTDLRTVIKSDPEVKSGLE